MAIALQYADPIANRGIVVRRTVVGIRIDIPPQDPMSVQRRLARSQNWPWWKQFLLVFLQLPAVNQQQNEAAPLLTVLQLSARRFSVTLMFERNRLTRLTIPRSIISELRPNRYECSLHLRIPGQVIRELLPGMPRDVIDWIGVQLQLYLTDARASPRRGESWKTARRQGRHGRFRWQSETSPLFCRIS